MESLFEGKIPKLLDCKYAHTLKWENCDCWSEAIIDTDDIMFLLASFYSEGESIWDFPRDNRIDK